MLALMGTRSWLLCYQVTCPPRKMYSGGKCSDKKQYEGNYAESWKTSRCPLEKHVDATAELEWERPILDSCSGVEECAIKSREEKTNKHNIGIIYQTLKPEARE